MMSKQIMLMRHGRDSANGALTNLGEQQADDVAQQLANDNLIPDLIIHSPVRRAVQTAQRVHDTFNHIAGRDVPMVVVEWLAEGKGGNIEGVTMLDDTKDLVLAVSHNDTIGSLYVHLTEGDEWTKFGSCSLFEIYPLDNCRTYLLDTRMDHWKDVEDVYDLSEDGISAQPAQFIKTFAPHPGQ